MKILILIVSFLYLPLASSKVELKPGDILLQPLHCWACNLIEGQTNSEYSHIGVVISASEKEILVAEAYLKVRAVSLEEFNSKTQKGLALEVLRPNFVSNDLFKNYYKHFHNKPYDRNFLWDDEKIYCSELVQKLFEISSMQSPRATPMEFDVNREYWERYFRGEVPDGELGISPEDFKQSGLYNSIGFL